MTPEEMERQALIAYLSGGQQMPQIPTTAGDSPEVQAQLYQQREQDQQQQTGYNVPPALQNSALLADVLTAGGVSEYQRGVPPFEHAGNTINRTLKMGSDIAGEVSLAYPTARSASEFSQGNYSQGIKEMLPHALTVATLGAGPAVNAVGQGLKQVSPAVTKATDYISRMPGYTGAAARQVAGRVPTAGAAVAGVEGAKELIDVGAAAAQQQLPPLPQFSESDPESVANLQRFLLENNIDIGGPGIDGRMGPGTRAGVRDYIQRAQQAQQALNDPGIVAARTAEATAAKVAAEANLTAANADLLKSRNEAEQGAYDRRKGETQRRAQVLGDAQSRYDNKDNSIGNRATRFIQEWAPTAIMGGAALAGASKIPFAQANKRAAVGQVDTLASNYAQTGATAAQRSGYNSAYDKIAKASPIDGGDAAIVGGLGAEIGLSEYKKNQAQIQYDKSITEFEREFNKKDAKGKQIPLDGAREAELADAVVRAKEELEKWTNLSGAGQHGLGFYGVGKGIALARKSAVAGPNANSTAMRSEFDPTSRQNAIRQMTQEQELAKGINARRANPIDYLPDNGRKTPVVPAQQSIDEIATDVFEQQAAKSAATATVAKPSASKAATGKAAKGAAASKTVKGGTDVAVKKEGAVDVVRAAPFSKKKKVEIAQAYASALDEGKKFTVAQAKKIAPGSDPEKVIKFVEKMRRFKKGGLSSVGIVDRVRGGDLAFAGATIGAGSAAGALSNEQERQALVDYLRSGL